MNCNHLKLNPAKTEFIYFGSPYMLHLCSVNQLLCVDQQIDRQSLIKHLGILLDSNLSMDMHITQKCRIEMLNLSRIRLL